MKVEVLGDRLKDAGYNLTKGDAVTVPDEVGTVWCSHGWAKDLDGNVETGERVLRPVSVNPKNLATRANASEVG